MGAYDPCNREEWEISLLQVFNVDQSDRAQDLPGVGNVPMEKLGTAKGRHLVGTVKRKKVSCGKKWNASCRAFSLYSSLPLSQFH